MYYTNALAIIHFWKNLDSCILLLVILITFVEWWNIYFKMGYFYSWDCILFFNLTVNYLFEFMRKKHILIFVFFKNCFIAKVQSQQIKLLSLFLNKPSLLCLPHSFVFIQPLLCISVDTVGLNTTFRGYQIVWM